MKRRAGERCGSSRSLGVVKQCAVYERGERRCVWCGVDLIEPRPWRTPDDADATHYATVDHLDGDPKNNSPENLVPACNGCNVSRAHEWEKGQEWEFFEALSHEWWDFDLYLQRKGADIRDAIQRVENQRWIALDRTAGRALAERWHADRIAYSRAWTKKRAQRRKDDHVRFAA